VKAVIQRVLSASVSINGNDISVINHGLLVLLGVEKDDGPADLNYMVQKTVGLRVFKDNKNNMNLSLQDVCGEALVISQFTLCADTRKGRRPNFINAAPPKIAEKIYLQYCEKLRKENISVKTGRFGSTMEVNLKNDGPVTIILNGR
ncbi:uncharacterized protein METZ01_LOCUS473860, partial [marine metagenome]